MIVKPQLAHRGLSVNVLPFQKKKKKKEEEGNVTNFNELFLKIILVN